MRDSLALLNRLSIISKFRPPSDPYHCGSVAITQPTGVFVCPPAVAPHPQCIASVAQMREEGCRRYGHPGYALRNFLGWKRYEYGQSLLLDDAEHIVSKYTLGHRASC